LTKDFHFTVNPYLERKPISPMIYGANQTLTETENWAARRIGGNRLTGYNWENNASNAGEDWQNSSDNYLTWINDIPTQNENIPAVVLTHFIDLANSYMDYTIVTLQMAGYVAADKNGTVTAEETAPSYRWDEVKAAKGSPFSQLPDLTDHTVYMDELVNLLVGRYGNAASASGVKAYALDNEPALWPGTHPRIHPEKTGCVELVNRSIEWSQAIKNVDPACEIYGPVLFGLSAYIFLTDYDWNDVKGKYKWFIDYYLAEMKKAEEANGRRLLDVLDVHWYSDAQGDERIGNASATSRKDKEARLQAPRTLWDKGYYENSWIGQWFKDYLPLIPVLQKSIDTYYPGTKLAITEFNYGGENDITGGIATADVLGIFGKLGVYAACYWQMQDETAYTSAAYKIYRNYDGSLGTFGDMSVQAATDDKVNSSIYASINGEDPSELHIIILNKDLDNAANGEIQISGKTAYTSAEVWYFNAQTDQIQSSVVQPQIIDNILEYEIPKSSVCHFVLHGSETAIAEKIKTVENFHLSIFPNPFNSACYLSYQIPAGQIGIIKIFNIQGMTVELVENLQGAGKFSWDAGKSRGAGLASGLYFIKLETPGKTIIHKASYIK